MRTSIILILCIFLIDNPAWSQTFDASQVGQSLGNLVSTIQAAETSGFGQSSRIYQQSFGSSYNSTDSEKYYASFSQQAAPAYRSMNENNNAYVNNNPRLNYIYTLFEARRMNGYYRDLEEWRKKQKAALKREGLYDRDAIEYIYSR
jgi:hypothetical protein